MSSSFSKEELERYSRHLIIPEFNIEGQLKLKQAKVLVVGSGGLGAPLLLYLAAAGVGHIGIVDFDVVEDSNLQRQVLFGTDDIGKPKVEAAKKRLQVLNPHIEIVTYNTYLSSDNALEILGKYDVVADGTDNFPTRYLVNDACVLLDIPNVYASIYRFEGQVSVFNYRDNKGELGPNFRDLFPSPPPPGLVPSCAEGGVLGVLPGIIGSLQANEVIKVITGLGESLSGRLFLLDAATFYTRTLNISRNPSNPLNGEEPSITELIDYQAFCGLNSEKPGVHEDDLEHITVSELKQWQTRGQDYQLIDVREPYEYEISNLGGTLIPKDSILEHIEAIRNDIPVVIHCRSGIRSANVIGKLKKIHGFENLFNLKGGILAWAEEIDTSLARY